MYRPWAATAAVVMVVTLALALVTCALAVAATAVRGWRHHRERRRSQDERLARPLLLALLDAAPAADSDGELPPQVARCLERLTVAMTTKVRGADRQALVDLLAQRGTLSQAQRACRSRRPIRRLHAVELLGAVAAPQTQDDLRERTRDRHPEVRRAAVRALGRIGDPATIPTLLDVLVCRRAPVPEHCVTLALLRCGTRGAQPLVSALDADDPVQRRAAARVLGWLGQVSAVPGLCRLLDDEEPVQLAALESLGRIGARESVGPLQELLDETHSASVREAAARALGQIGDPGSAPSLARLLTAEHDLARHAATALGHLGEAGRTLLERVPSCPEAGEALWLPPVSGDRAPAPAAGMAL